MALNLNKNNKLYYSIKEVAEMVGVNESTLRYWESEFPQLRPRTVATTKVRQYTQKDIEQVRVSTILSRCVASRSPLPASTCIRMDRPPTGRPRSWRSSPQCAMT